MKSYVEQAEVLQRTFANSYKKFSSCLENVKEMQQNMLFDLIEFNKNSQFGRGHHFSAIKDIDGYRNDVPIRNYHDYLPYIAQIKSGHENILTAEIVECLELTSGSTDNCKFIPYTKSLYRDFQKAISPWLYDLYNNKKAGEGSFYWSITPAIKITGRLESQIPIGMGNDIGYFSQ